MKIADLIALLRVAEHDARAETIFVGLMPGANVKWSLARLASEAADLIEAELVEPERDAKAQYLSELLARIHRDGGHYEAEHGTRKAVADADLIVAELNALHGDGLQKDVQS